MRKIAIAAALAAITAAPAFALDTSVSVNATMSGSVLSGSVTQTQVSRPRPSSETSRPTRPSVPSLPSRPPR